MTHLPECYWPDLPERSICICDRLRACEHRVTERWESLRGWGESYAYHTGSNNGFDAGYTSALHAVRERIMRLPYDIDDKIVIDRDEVLGWIDALRGEA